MRSRAPHNVPASRAALARADRNGYDRATITFVIPVKGAVMLKACLRHDREPGPRGRDHHSKLLCGPQKKHLEPALAGMT